MDNRIVCNDLTDFVYLIVKTNWCRQVYFYSCITLIAIIHFEDRVLYASKYTVDVYIYIYIIMSVYNITQTYF